MEQCVLGVTQNQNESFNSMIWNRCPKNEFASTIVVEISVDMAVITFYSGQGHEGAYWNGSSMVWVQPF